MKSNSKQREVGKLAEKASVMLGALNAPLTNFGNSHIFEVANNDTVFSTGGLAVNDLASADKLRAPLETLVQTAAMNDDLTPEIDFLAPRVDVSGQNGYFSYMDRSGGINTLTSLNSIERAINGTVSLIDGAGTEVAGFCKSYGLGSEIDEDRCGDVQLEMQTRIMEIMELISLNRLQIRIAALVAIANNTAKTWGSSANPDGDARDVIQTALTGSGIRPNCAYYDVGAWNARQSAYERQATAGAFQGTLRDEAGHAAYLKLRQTIVSKALQKDAAGTLTALYSNKAMFFRNNAAATRRSNDILKTFSCDDNGVQFRTHQRQVSEKVWRVAVTFREVVLVTGPVTGNPVQQITVTPA
jgi:hypothetical protein